MKKALFILLNVGLLAAFAACAWTAVRTKGPTFDETLHVPAAILHLRGNDFRMNAEHPPLWKYWAALPTLAGPTPELNVEMPAFREATRDNAQGWAWARRTMYATPGNDADALLFRSRAMMLALGVLVGAGLCAWAWRLGGPLAATLATALFALDPNLAGHAPLVTNDVVTAGLILLIAWATWRLGRRATLGRAVVLGLACGATAATKYTGLLAGPIVAVLLVGRALADAPWPARGGRPIDRRGARLLAAAGGLAVVAVVSYATLWASYGFRYDAAPGGAPRHALARMADDATADRIKRDERRVPTPAEVAAAPRDLPCRVALALAERRVLPEAWLAGFLHAYAQSIYRATYLLGEPGGGGVWWYFPFALLVKEPVATLAVVGLATIVGMRRAIATRRSKAEAPAGDDALVSSSASDVRIPDRWAWACLLVPPALLMLAAMRVDLNIGVRHVFQVFPFAFIACGLVLAPTLARATTRGRVVAGVLAIALAAESLAARPDYVAFFNVAAGGSRGGLRLLGDSNLDWGQDLPALVDWQRHHPQRTLSLAYFGTDSPRARGLRYLSILDDPDGGPSTRGLPGSGIVAISATLLQSRWDDPQAAKYFRTARDQEPTEVLGGTIYLYDLGGE